MVKIRKNVKENEDELSKTIKRKINE